MKRIWLVVAMASTVGCGHHVRGVVSPGPVTRENLVERVEPARVKRAETPCAAVVEATEEAPVIPATKPKPIPPDPKVINGQLQDAFFDYDRAEPDAQALAALRSDAELLIAILKDLPNFKITIEGHCDDRGSAEYNMGLGERRARRALDVLRELGFPAEAARIISYGKEAPQCEEATEACRHLNRRAHLVVRE